MDKIWKKALALGGGVGAAVIIVIGLLLLLSNVTIRSPPASLPTQPPGGGNGGGTPPGANCNGNGHSCPHGWANAACPDPPAHATAYGVRARCDNNMTWGEMKKAA